MRIFNSIATSLTSKIVARTRAIYLGKRHEEISEVGSEEKIDRAIKTVKTGAVKIERPLLTVGKGVRMVF